MGYNFGPRLRKYRELKNLSQKEFAALIGVSNGRVSNWEQGINRPDVDLLSLICHTLSVSPSELLDLNIADTPINALESNLVDKYRTLDAHGKKLVDIVLDTEYNRVAATTSPACSPKKDNVVLVAARGGDGVDAYTISDEAAQEADEAIARLEKAGVDHEADDL